MEVARVAYHSDHWVMSEPNFTVKKTEKSDMIVFTHLNPTDKRCWRLIVRAVMKKQNSSSQCLDYSSSINLMPDDDVFVTLLKECFAEACDISRKLVQFGLLGQIEFAGNNAMSSDTNNPQIMKLGSETEPWIPHVHIIFRAAMGTIFLNSPYCGPQPGELFDMRKNKLPWDVKEQLEFQDKLQALLRHY